MIYQRRALQRRLDELRDVLANDMITSIVNRLNRAGRDRVAAMWEVIVIHALSKCGDIQSEIALDSGRRPDIKFVKGRLQFIADVTAVSDESLDIKNPYHELGLLLEAAKDKLQLPMGGLNITIRSKKEKTKRGTQTVLLLPPRGKLQEFVNKTILPELREQIRAGKKTLQMNVNGDGVSIDIVIDPSKSPYSSYSFAAYDSPQIKDRNPLYNALKEKAEQLRGVQGLSGVIVGDGDCVALSGRSTGNGTVSTNEIIAEFFRQFSSIDFVLILSVREERNSWYDLSSPTRYNDIMLHVREGCDAIAELNSLFGKLPEYFPKPAMMPVNGALRAREDEYPLGHHGGYFMSGTDMIRIGLREFTEIFAGLRSIQDGGAKNVEAARKLPRIPNELQGRVLQNLMEGRLPKSIEIIKTDEDDSDDWVEIHFGEIDPAIAPFR